MNKSILLLLTLITLHVTAQKQTKSIEKEINEILRLNKTAGISVAVVKGNKIIYAKGFGYSDFERKIPADTSTLFMIGSSTKAFTAAILGQLRDEDKISFDDKPSKILPELTFYNEEMNSSIVVKDLMCHRTGLPRHDGAWYFFPTKSKDSLLARIQYHEPTFGVRKNWQYNNFMYLVQGVIAERVTGKSWEQNINDRFFIPLEMKQSRTSLNEVINNKKFALGYGINKDSIFKIDYFDIQGMSPAGSIISSANDMSKWMIVWLNNGKYKGNQILSTSFLNEATSSQMVITGGNPSKQNPDIFLSNYGYGWMISSYKGHYRVEHGGNINGFSANVALYPSDSLGIVVLSNQDGSHTPNVVRNIIANHFLDLKKEDMIQKVKDYNKKERETPNNENSITKKNIGSLHDKKDFEGKFSHPGYGTFYVKMQHDTLFAITPNKKMFLKHVHYDVFDAFEVVKSKIDTTQSSSIPLIFNTNYEGKIESVDIKIEEELKNPIKFIKQPEEIDLSNQSLNQYIEEYELSGMTIKIYTKNG